MEMEVLPRGKGDQSGLTNVMAAGRVAFDARYTGGRIEGKGPTRDSLDGLGNDA